MGTELAITKIYETIALNQRDKSQCNVVCRDVAKAFDKVWHTGLQYKILRLQLPDVLEKILCNFLNQQMAQIKFGNFIREKFPLESGVLQGSILSPTLYIYYTSDLAPAGAGWTDVLFTDDITQIVEYEGRSKKFLARRTQREIERINLYEKKWKIKTNQSRSKILSISKVAPERIMINNRQINMANDINILDFTLNRTGFRPHITKWLAIARGTVNKLKRFKRLKAKTKSYLYKTLVCSSLEYPNTPMCVMSTTNKKKLQSFQNGIIRRHIHNEEEIINEGYENDDEGGSIEELHKIYGIEPINSRMYRRVKINWDKFAATDETIYECSTQANREIDQRDHAWWRRIAPYVEEDEPECIY